MLLLDLEGALHKEKNVTHFGTVHYNMQ